MLKKMSVSVLILSMLLMLCSCSTNSADSTTTTSTQSSDSSSVLLQQVQTDETDSGSAQYTLSEISDYESSTEIPEDAVTINLDDITGDCEITEAGNYVLTGTLSNGKILVNVDDQVHLFLEGVTVHSNDGSAIALFGKKKKVITLVDGYENNLYDNESYTTFYNDDNDEPNACLFSKNALTINGNGTLNLYATGTFTVTNEDGTEETKSAQGIACKDDLKILDAPTINIEAVGNGIKGKNFVEIYGGTYNITAGNDGIKSDNEDDASTLGYVYIGDGTFVIDADSDGISAYADLTIAGGTFDITAGGGAQSAAKRTVYTGSYDGLKNTQGTLRLLGGTIEINALHNGIDSSNCVLIDGAEITVNCSGATSEGMDGKTYVHGHGIHADVYVYVESGSVDIQESYEGIEGNLIYIDGGTVKITSTDDGFNASSETNDDSSCLLSLNGGYVYVNALGDGLDSNGNIEMTGGVVVVDGPTSSNDGALDYGDSNNYMKITGGILACIGSNGMVENPSSSSTQVYAGFSVSASFTAGEEISIYDGDTLLFTFTTLKARSSSAVIQVSSPDLVSGQSYTCSYGSSTTTFTGGSVTSTGMGGGMGGGQSNSTGGAGGSSQGGFRR